MSMFECYNDDGNLQFSAETYAYYFVGKGSFIMEDRFADPDRREGYLDSGGSTTVGYDFDLVAFSCPTAYIYPDAWGRQGPTPNRTIFCYAQPIASDITVSTGNSGLSPGSTPLVYYWAFRKMKYLSPSSTGVGIELYTDTGEVAYSSILANKPMIAKNVRPITGYNTSWTDSFTLPSGPSYAHLIYGTVRTPGSAPVMKNATSTSVDLKAGYIYSTIPAQSNGGLLTIDVSGY